MSDHLDLDALADVLAGEPAPDHLATCTSCQARLAELTAAVGRVDADLAALAATPLPPLPALEAPAAPEALEEEPAPAPVEAPKASVTVLPSSSPVAKRSAARWVGAAGGLAAAAVLVLGGVLLFQKGGTSNGDKTTAEAARPRSVVALSNSGTDYLANGVALKAALPQLLKGTATPALAPLRASDSAVPSTAGSSSGTAAPSLATGLAPDPLARLRSVAGLASCIAGLTEPTDPGVPLALDYASYEGKPALMVILQGSKPTKLDVYFVGPTCNQVEQAIFLYVRADKPAS